MSLYDDDIKTTASEKVQGWSSGIKLFQSQLQLKKAAVTQPKRDATRKQSLLPVIDLKSKFKDDEETQLPFPKLIKSSSRPSIIGAGGVYGLEYDWNIVDEYDPLWPNEYEKCVKDIRNQRDKENEMEDKLRRERKRKSRFSEPDDSPPRNVQPIDTPQMTAPSVGSGFAGRWADNDDEIIPAKVSRPSGGAAIAPPPSLQEPSADPEPIMPNKPQPVSTAYGGSVAAKIMARYGFKEGQGLGKMEQGMSMALQVEKTSKRGGRILHEKDIMPPPPPIGFPPSLGDQPKPPITPITELMKNPSKVVLLKNMVGPGEVDDDLEPEVKDECNTKYGPVASCIIHEIPHDTPEECVRIFLEFQRIESAVKAVVDLNGRYFGGRQVRAGFYDAEKFDNLQLMD